MVGGDGVDGAVFQSFPQCGPVLRCPKRGIHLEPSVFLQVVLAKYQIVRRRLASDADAGTLRLPDQRDTFFRRDMADMIAAARLGGQFQIAGDLAPFTFGADAFVFVGCTPTSVVDVATVQQGIVFAMGGQNAVQLRRPAHGLQHHIVLLDAASVVGEGDATAFQRFKIHGLQPLSSSGDGSVGEHLNACVSVDEGLLDGNGLGRIGCRI